MLAADIANSSTRSAITAIDGIPAADFLLSAAQASSQYNDPDAIYNTLFRSVPIVATFGGGDFFTFGINDTSIYTFANGTNSTVFNYAVVSPRYSVNWAEINSGQCLYNLIEVTPEATSADSAAAAPSTSDVIATTTSITGYPTPVVMQVDGYTSGYFLNDGTAVLAIQSFDVNNASYSSLQTSLAHTRQQSTIKSFLNTCRSRNASKIVVDLSANGGGNILNGYDAFVQFFPSITPYGGARFRDTPMTNYLGEIIADGYGKVFGGLDIDSPWSLDQHIDIHLKDFKNWKDLQGPYTLYNDNFTSIVRSNLTTLESNLNVTGHGDQSQLPPQTFTAENIVLLMDGLCGSTCSIFAELMKTQGNVRSVAVGGRAQLGPMQYVGGSKA